MLKKRRAPKAMASLVLTESGKGFGVGVLGRLGGCSVGVVDEIEVRDEERVVVDCKDRIDIDEVSGFEVFVGSIRAEVAGALPSERAFPLMLK